MEEGSLVGGELELPRGMAAKNPVKFNLRTLSVPVSAAKPIAVLYS